MEQAQKKFMSLEVSQVGIIVKNRDKTLQQLSSLLGTGDVRLHDLDQPEATVHGKKTACKARLAFTQVGPLELELIEPVEGESIWAEFLETKGEGVQHLGVFVPDLDNELARMKEMGIGVLQSGEDDHVRFAYMDTEGVIGVIIELLHLK